MNVEYRTGDLFAQKDVSAIGHGVNIVGNMGSGIAVLFKEKFPEMHEDYVEQCYEQLLELGSVFSWFEPTNGLHVFNIATQINPGADASLAAVEVGLINAVREAEYNGLSSFAIPQIGCGIGGLIWDDESAGQTTVKQIVEKVAATTDVKIVVVTFG